MSPLPEHEKYNRTLALVVEVLAEELNIDVKNLGSTTFRRETLARGFEPDSCFIFSMKPTSVAKRPLISALIRLPIWSLKSISPTRRSISSPSTPRSVYQKSGVITDSRCGFAPHPNWRSRLQVEPRSAVTDLHPHGFPGAQQSIETHRFAARVSCLDTTVAWREDHNTATSAWDKSSCPVSGVQHKMKPSDWQVPQPAPSLVVTAKRAFASGCHRASSLSFIRSAHGLAQRGGIDRGGHGLHRGEDLLGKEAEALFGLVPGACRRRTRGSRASPG